MSKKVRNLIYDYLILTIGCLLYSLAWTHIFLPNSLVSGGMTGLCAIVEYATLGAIRTAISYPILNTILILLGFVLLGKSFGIRTIVSLGLIALFMSVLPLLGIQPLILKPENKILLPFIASFLEAIGIAMMLNHGGSSGGTDIIAMIVFKYWPVSIGKVYICLDIAIIASVMLLPGRTVDDAIYGYIAMICFSLSLDYIMLGRKSSVQILVFSDKYAEIADYINNVMERGVTAIDAKGWYSKANKEILLILVRRNQMRELTNKIKELDPHAFVTISPVTSVYGEGFEEIKNGFKLKKKIKK